MMSESTDFEKWLEVAQKHPFGYGIPSEEHLALVLMGSIPEFAVPAQAMGTIYKAIVMYQKGVVWFDENGAQIGASAYQGAGEQYIWIGGDMGQSKEPNA